MLKNIPSMVSPELLKALCEMGHSDRICIGDGNFPGAAMAKAGGAILLRADGHGIPELLEAVLKLFPLDTYVEKPVMLMARMPCDEKMSIPIWRKYERILRDCDGRENTIEYVERFAFYEEAKKCYCIVQTSEASQYANIILQKGLVR